jgi:hypothetical protein
MDPRCQQTPHRAQSCVFPLTRDVPGSLPLDENLCGGVFSSPLTDSLSLSNRYLYERCCCHTNTVFRSVAFLWYTYTTFLEMSTDWRMKKAATAGRESWGFHEQGGMASISSASTLVK